MAAGIKIAARRKAKKEIQVTLNDDSNNDVTHIDAPEQPAYHHNNNIMIGSVTVLAVIAGVFVWWYKPVSKPDDDEPLHTAPPVIDLFEFN